MNPLCDDPLPERHHPEQPPWRESASAGASKEIAATGYAGHAATENGRWPRGDRKYEGVILITLRKRERVTPLPASLVRFVEIRRKSELATVANPNSPLPLVSQGSLREEG